MILGIDLALRHTGVAILNDDCSLHSLSVLIADNLVDEQIFIYYENEFTKLFNKYNFTTINIEGLSFGGLSSKKDIIAGLFWYVRLLIYKFYGEQISVNIIPVLSWRNKLFTKTEKQQHRQAKKQLANLQKGCDEYETQKQLADIKYQTYLKLPHEIQSYINNKTSNKTYIYDMTDAYFIAKHTCQ